jgi:hypothetical protein
LTLPASSVAVQATRGVAEGEHGAGLCEQSTAGLPSAASVVVASADSAVAPFNPVAATN